MRYFFAALLLLAAGINGALAWTVETCTGNSPESLYGGVISLALNILGMMVLLWRKPALTGVIVATGVAAFPAINYTLLTAELAIGFMRRGIGACDVITGYGPWGPSGDEPVLIWLWIATCAVVWFGTVIAMWRAYLAARKEKLVEQAS